METLTSSSSDDTENSECGINETNFETNWIGGDEFHSNKDNSKAIKYDLNYHGMKNESEGEKWECLPQQNLEKAYLTLLIGNESVNLVLSNDLLIKDVSNIISDMYGLAEENFTICLNNEELEPGRELKFISENDKLQLIVNFIGFYNKNQTGKNNINQDILPNLQNASVQTKPTQAKVTRQTQTPCFPLVEKSTNTPHDKSVQADYQQVSNEGIILEPKKYITHDDFIKYQNEKAVMIQKSIRRFLAQKRIIKMKKDRDLMNLKNKLQKDEIDHEELQVQLKSILEKRTVPSLDDFSKAYSCLAEWLKKEKHKTGGLKGQDKITALKALLSKEMHSLQYINKIRMAQRNESELNRKTKIVEKASKPIIREYPKGNKTLIEDDNTHISKLFNDMLISMRNTNCSKDVRLQFLEEFKYFLDSMGVPECTNEMLSLVERECQMILLGVNTVCLEGTRKRLLELFIHFSIDPEFNPGAKKVTSTLQSGMPLLQCRICKELKQSCEFNIDILQGLRDCTKCSIRRELSHANLSLVPYKAMLKDICIREQRLGCNDGYITFLQPADLYYLVQRIWEGRSCLSEENDLKLLKLVRWELDQIWSPWNCILLTEREVDLHSSIICKDKFYGQFFIKKIHNKHLQAKIKFKKLEILYEEIHSGPIECKYNDGKSKEECQLTRNPIRFKTKNMFPKFMIMEPISDLIFP